MSKKIPKIIALLGASGVGKDTIAGFVTQYHPVRNLSNCTWRDVWHITGDDRRSRLVHGSATIALADPIKEYAQDLYGFTDLQLWGPSEERNKPDQRYPREHESHILMNNETNCRNCGASFEEWGDRDARIPCVSYATPREVCQKLGTEAARSIYPGIWLRKFVQRLESFFWDHSLVIVSDTRFENELRFVRESGGEVIEIVRPNNPSALQGVQNAHVSEDGSRADWREQYITGRIVNNGTLSDLYGMCDKIKI